MKKKKHPVEVSRKKYLQNVFYNLAWFAVPVAIALVFKAYVGDRYVIPSGSMEPTLQIGDSIYVNKLPNSLTDYQRGDLVIFKTNARINAECGLEVQPANFIQRYQWQIQEALGAEPVPLEEYQTTFVKRLIGLPGDTIEVVEGQVMLNGEGLKEEYLKPLTATEQGYSLSQTTVPNDTVVVFGDNRLNSCDSSAWGFLPAAQLEGKVAATILPFARRQTHSSPNYALAEEEK